jgi:hypothetical protein
MSPVDPVRADDGSALSGLPEDIKQPHDLTVLEAMTSAKI